MITYGARERKKKTYLGTKWELDENEHRFSSTGRRRDVSSQFMFTIQLRKAARFDEKENAIRVLSLRINVSTNFTHDNGECIIAIASTFFGRKTHDDKT